MNASEAIGVVLVTAISIVAALSLKTASDKRKHDKEAREKALLEARNKKWNESEQERRAHTVAKRDAEGSVSVRGSECKRGREAANVNGVA